MKKNCMAGTMLRDDMRIIKVMSNSEKRMDSMQSCAVEEKWP